MLKKLQLKGCMIKVNEIWYFILTQCFIHIYHTEENLWNLSLNKAIEEEYSKEGSQYVLFYFIKFNIDLYLGLEAVIERSGIVFSFCPK